MAKTLVVKIKKAGATLSEFSIFDNFGNSIATNISLQSLVSGYAISVENDVTVIVIKGDGQNCCNKSWNIPIATITIPELADMTFTQENTSSVWTHLNDNISNNSFYGCTHSYIIEYPFAYQYYDEVVQNIKDYTKVYKYLSSSTGVFNTNRKIQTNDNYFNKAVLYNDQQSSGILTLVPKPSNNLKAYNSYPIFGIDSKTITFTKADNFYQFNTFWSLIKDVETPLFTNSCVSMSIDKEVNQDNMDYSSRSFRKDKIKAKDLKVRLILDNRTDVHLVSTFIIAPSQISYR